MLLQKIWSSLGFLIDNDSLFDVKPTTPPNRGWITCRPIPSTANLLLFPAFRLPLPFFPPLNPSSFFFHYYVLFICLSLYLIFRHGCSAYQLTYFPLFKFLSFSSSSYLIICQNTCRLKRAFVTSSPLPLRPIIRLSPILFLNLRLHNHLFCSCFSSFPSLPPLVSFPSFLPSFAAGAHIG